MDWGHENANESQFGRHDSRVGDVITSLPFACGSHLTKSLLSANCGIRIGSASTFLPPVPGLQPTICPSSVRCRGAMRSMCDGPRTHPRHVPYCSFFADTPNDVY